MHNHDNQYTAYLLRFWRESDGSWRATVQDAHTGKRQSFAGREALMRFLGQQLGQPQHAVSDPGDDPCNANSSH